MNAIKKKGVKGYPPVEVARIHSHHKSVCCPKCEQPWSECPCEVDMDALPSKPHLARAWGFKGTMRLPEDHPDHPGRHRE